MEAINHHEWARSSLARMLERCRLAVADELVRLAEELRGEE